MRRHQISDAEDALARAQELTFDAMDARTKAERVRLARKAVDISPLCADAFGILATAARSDVEALPLWRQALTAGETALNPRTFIDDVGYFWGLLETRPYMRARAGLAQVLWRLGERDEAITHLHDLLRLCPNDNMGLRYLLLSWLAETGRDADLDVLVKAYRGEDGALWTWPLALAAFRAKGDGAAARKALRRAMESNRHVADFLSGARGLPRSDPPYYAPGDISEAVLYAREGSAAWAAVPGAFTWLRANVGIV